ncbi:hypothetical protein HZF05_03900 [Sphingomonas sp. CGMCC 1.13654]|uniref:Uncharacterized protein n=1 Tax=Sphingomonas chungangi TaxID=2683589 RepID=A0A838L3V3_9SPHN|nr:hypothetical protein [Sphingomonas chungangi]MBA2933232.1 hypothetical protein [Sphingomonas chungangi]
MIAIGCLLLVILPIAGFMLGLFVSGISIAIGLAVAGFVIAAAVCCVTGYALAKAGRRA